MICVKGKDNRGIVLLGSNIDGVNNCSTVQRHEKSMSSKTSFSCCQLAKRYNKGMGGIDRMD